jgi:hypothetical protein
MTWKYTVFFNACEIRGPRESRQVTKGRDVDKRLILTVLNEDYARVTAWTFVNSSHSRYQEPGQAFRRFYEAALEKQEHQPKPDCRAWEEPTGLE